MKSKIKYMIVLLLLIIFTPTAFAAAESSGAVLTAENNAVSVALNLPEGKTETITSMRLFLRVSAESGTIEEPSFQFENSIKSMVRDAEISKQSDGSYLVDLILSGKEDQDIFSGSEYTKIGKIFVSSPGGQYQIKVEAADETGDTSAPSVKYVDAGGADEITVFLTDHDPIMLQNDPREISADRSRKLKLNARTKTKNVIFEWEECKSASGYVIYEYEGKVKGYQELKTINGSAVTAYSHVFKYASKHTFCIRAFWRNSDGSIDYGLYGPDIKVTLAPDRVKKLSVKKKAKVTLSWKKVAGAKGYQIYAAKKKNGKYKLLKTIKNARKTKFIVKTPKAGKTYYKVRAYVNNDNGKKKYGEFSAAKS